MRNYAKYEKVLLKPWYPNSLQQWTAGEPEYHVYTQLALLCKKQAQ